MCLKMYFKFNNRNNNYALRLDYELLSNIMLILFIIKLSSFGSMKCDL